MNLLTEEQLKKLPTPRLLAYYKARRQGLFSLAGILTHSGDVPENLKPENVLNNLGNSTYREYYDLDCYLKKVKEILDQRENVE